MDTDPILEEGVKNRPYLRVPHYAVFPSVCMNLRLPILVYVYDQRSKQYHFETCFQCEVPGAPLPKTLTSSASIGVLGDNIELLKAAMRFPALVLRKGLRTQIYNASCDPVQTLPSDVRPMRILRAYELPHLNLSTLIAHYRLRGDGALVLAGTARIHCTMCYVPDQMDMDYMRSHLRSRVHVIRKLLRDRRIVVEVADKVSVYSWATLRHAPDKRQVLKS